MGTLDLRKQLEEVQWIKDVPRSSLSNQFERMADDYNTYFLSLEWKQHVNNNTVMLSQLQISHIAADYGWAFE